MERVMGKEWRRHVKKVCALWQVERAKRASNKRKKGNLVENKNSNYGTVDVDMNGNATECIMQWRKNMQWRKSDYEKVERVMLNGKLNRSVDRGSRANRDGRYGCEGRIDRLHDQTK